MKRIITLLLAVTFAIGSISAAQASGIDIKAKGQFDFAFGMIDNAMLRKSYNNSPRLDGPGRGGKDVDNFEARQRVRAQINFIASENLQGVVMFEIGDMDWGRPGKGRQQGAGLDADAVNVETKRAYIDWIIPNTQVSVRMGVQGVALPAGRMSNPVFDADVAGIVVSSPITDNFALTGFWLRPFNKTRWGTDDANKYLRDETDMFGLIAPITFDGVAFTPYVVYANVGNNSGFWEYLVDPGFLGVNNFTAKSSSTGAWWLGANLNVDILDPLVFNLDAIYGQINSTKLGQMFWDGVNWNDGIKTKASGWYIGTTLDYKLDWGTPGIFAWYASGDKSSAFDNGEIKIGRMPVLGVDGGFTPTSFGTNGYYGIGNSANDNGRVTATGTGTWGIGIQVADVSFIQDLSHTLRFAYYQGTNSATLVEDLGGTAFLPYGVDGLYLTTKDSVFEVNFDHVYKVYENLEVCLELGWLHLRSDKDTWGVVGNTDLKKNDDAWKAELYFRYKF